MSGSGEASGTVEGGFVVGGIASRAGPVSMTGLGAGKAADPVVVDALVDRTRGAVQQLLEEELSGRRSVYL